MADDEAYRLAYDIYQLSKRVHMARAFEEGDDW